MLASDDSDSVFGDLQMYASTSSQDVSFSTEDTSLQSIMRVLRSIHATTSRLEQKLVTVEAKQMKLSDSFKELNSIVRKQEKDNFNIKGSSLEVPLKEETARIFCLSLHRNPPDSDIQVAVVQVLGRLNQSERYKIQLALRYCKGKLTEFRSEERRKVLGHPPYTDACHQSTQELGRHIMRQMHCPEDIDEEIYFRHLAIFRKFVRLCKDDKEANHSMLRTWLGSSSIEEDRWSAIMEEDKCFDYATNGVGREFEVVSEVEVPYHTGESDQADDCLENQDPVREL